MPQAHSRGHKSRSKLLLLLLLLLLPLMVNAAAAAVVAAIAAEPQLGVHVQCMVMVHYLHQTNASGFK
jgi:hypothetical protein